MEIILASASPRRRELLAQMGVRFTVRTVPHDETMDPHADPADEVARVSIGKAEAVLPLCGADDVIIAADTIVVCQGEVMGKPRSEADACSMLRRLSGREHQVLTGLTVCSGGLRDTVTVKTALKMRPLSDAEIRAYIATGDPMDKAGAYGIQGLAAMFVAELRGDYYNVMGLPVCTLALLLRKHGVPLLGVL